MRKKMENIVCGAVQCDECVHNCNYPPCGMVRITVDRLIENSVGFVTDNNDGGKWIPVSERLPTWADGNKYGGILAVRRGHELSDFYHFKDVKENPDEFTHWMPLPTPPKDGDT